MSANHPPLLFCHIPKTAGTSVRRALGRALPDVVDVYEGQLRLPGPDEGFLHDVGRRSSAPALFYGHFSYGVHRFLGVAPRYATFIRHPTDRLVSLYRHHAADEGSHFHRRIAAGMTLAEFVRCRDSEETNNHMCRVIAGIPPESGVRIRDPAVVDAAMDNLRRHFVFIGLVERFEESMRKLEAVLGVPLRDDDHVNAARRPAPALDDATLNSIRYENGLDLELFDRAARLAGRCLLQTS